MGEMKSSSAIEWKEGFGKPVKFNVQYRMVKALDNAFNRMANYIRRREQNQLADMVRPDQEAIMVSVYQLLTWFKL